MFTATMMRMLFHPEETRAAMKFSMRCDEDSDLSLWVKR
jgi:hypothetical protein